MTEEASPEPFTLRDVILDAWRSLGRAWTLHLGAGVVMIGVSTVACCLVTCGMVPIAMLFGLDVDETGQRTSTSTPLVVTLWGAYLLTGYVLLVLHEGVTLHATHVAVGGQRPRLRDATRAALRRGPALAAAGLARLVIDVTPPAAIVAVGVGVLVAVRDAAGDTELVRASTAIAATVGYFALLAWLLVVRAHVGLALSVVVRDGVGPIEAFASSRRLLRDRRAHFALYRFGCFAAGFIAYFLLVLPPFLLLGFYADEIQRTSSGTSAFIGLVIVVVVYGVLAVLTVVDTVLVAAYHARLAKPVDATTLAKIFE